MPHGGQCRPSWADELAAIVGDKPLTRTEIVPRMWDYIKANECRDSVDKREIVADDRLRAVFGQDRMKMMGLLSAYLNAI